jgi:hypothetical protein
MVTPFLVAIAAVLVALTANGATAVDFYAQRTYVHIALAHAAVYALAAWWVLVRPAAARDFMLILGVAILLRAIATSTAPGLTTDAYRYVWDGRLMLAGVSPYLYVPTDPALAAFADPQVLPHINQKDTAFTIYPPVAQLAFMLGAALDGVLGTGRDAGHNGMKAVMLLAETLTVWALVKWLDVEKLPRQRVLIYAWHPLPLWELASQAHIDAVAMALVVLGLAAAVRGGQAAAGVSMAAAALVKYFAVVLLPAVWKRGDWRLPVAFALTAVVLYSPHLVVAGPKVIGFLATHLDDEGYAQGWGFHPVWFLRDFKLGDMSGRTYALMALAILGGLAFVALFARRAGEVRSGQLVMLATAFIWLTSAHYPWYFAWLIPLLVIAPHPAPLLMTLTAATLHLPRPPGGPTWTEIYIATYWVPALLLIVWELGRRWRRQG